MPELPEPKKSDYFPSEPSARSLSKALASALAFHTSHLFVVFSKDSPGDPNLKAKAFLQHVRLVNLYRTRLKKSESIP
jgi:hypothetical protein